jgi:hypothetical protein
MASKNDIFSLAGKIGISARGGFGNRDKTKLRAGQLHYRPIGRGILRLTKWF